MRSGIIFGVRNLVIRNAVGRIEHAQAEARGENPLCRARDFSFSNRAGLYFVDQSAILATACEVRAGLYRCHRCRTLGRGEFMAAVNIADGAAIAYNVALESPLLTEILLQQVCVGAAGLPFTLL